MVQTGAKVGVNYIKYYGDKITKTGRKPSNARHHVFVDGRDSSFKFIFESKSPDLIQVNAGDVSNYMKNDCFD